MFKPFVLPAAFLAGFVSLPADAANVSISAGQADFDFFYQIASGDETSSGEFANTLDYYDVGLSVDRGAYTFAVNITGLLEKEVQEYFEGSPDGRLDVERDSLTFSVARSISDNLTLAGGFYASDLSLNDAEYSSPENSVETEALFASLTFANQLTGEWLWYGRVGAQFNQAELNASVEEVMVSDTLDGYGYLFGAGLIYPLNDAASLKFGAEFKEFNYDGGRFDLNEDQTLFTIGYNYGF
jgi:hypothetical protein